MVGLKDYKAKDELILSLFKSNPQAAFRLMFTTYYMPLCVYAVQITDSFSLAEDIVQDFFCSFWERKLYRGIAVNLKSYLFYAIRNNAYCALRKNNLVSLEELGDMEIPEVDALADEKELREAVQRALHELEQLPRQERIVVEKIILESKMYKEVALELNVSVNTVKTHLSRALKRLRKSNMLWILCLLANEWTNG